VDRAAEVAPLGAPDPEAVDGALELIDTDELVARALAPGTEVMVGARVGGEDLKDLAGFDEADLVARLDQRQRAAQAAGIKAAGGGGRWLMLHSDNI
jgi:hypothetical protein